jgi:hypothetical protein
MLISSPLKREKLIVSSAIIEQSADAPISQERGVESYYVAKELPIRASADCAAASKDHQSANPTVAPAMPVFLVTLNTGSESQSEPGSARVR